MNKSFIRLGAAVAALVLACGGAHAQIVINDTLTGGHSMFNWLARDGACLTAGDNTNTPSDGTQYTPATATLTIPKCNGLNYYTTRGSTLVGGATGTGVDVAGSGALRLTNGDFQQGGNGDSQKGAIISNFTFPMKSGVQVTWTSVTYGGDNFNGTGADGISFFLSDGSKTPTSAGGVGGSLGYSCSNTNNDSNTGYDGLLGGYVGIGIDEFGNFTNGSIRNSNGTYNNNDNTASGSGYNPGQIGVRGAGNITWSELNRLYPAYYPTSASSSQRLTAVQQTCITGHLYNTLSGTANTSSSTAILDYPYLTSSVLPTTGSNAVQIANQQASGSSSSSSPNVSTRGAAVPISYSLRITSAGVMDFSYSVNGGSSTSVLTGFDITASNGPVPASLRFGFSAGTGGGSNIHEITCFKAAPADNSNSSAGSNVQSANVRTGTQVYLAYYHPVNWWGQLTSANLQYDPVADALLPVSPANWDANCVLTGGACSATTGSNTAPGWASRVILSNNGAAAGGAGVAFTASGLTSAQLTALGDTSTSAPRLAYLRGDRSNEVGSGSSAYRVRSSVLGDIVDSSPAWVGYPNSAYTGPWADKLGTTANATMAEGTSYVAFKTGNATRQNVVYVGANDGMLHGFAAGAFLAPSGSAAPAFNTAADNTGKELIAYMPAQVVSTIHSSSPSLDFSHPSYSHNFFVDATPGSGDLYYNSAWHTWLVGGLGPGGHAGGAVASNSQQIAQPVGALFALDITNPVSTDGTSPANTNFAQSNASTIVVGEWNSSTLTCVTPSTLPACGIYLGQVTGTPLIRRLHDGSWGVIFGNGTNSIGAGTAATRGHSGLFIMHVATNGTKTFQYLDANAGPNGGIVQVAAVDLDGDHVTDYVYAGDVLGNLYRFDLTNTSSANWTSMTLFTAGSNQPITTAPVISSILGTGTNSKKLIVAFGTGQKLPVTVGNPEIYSSTAQALYGIWDANMGAWNQTATDTKYAALTQSNATTPVAITASLLTGQTITTSGTTRTLTNVTICWAGGTACGSNTQMGWTVPLPSTSGIEQALYNPSVKDGFFYINTTIPATSQVLTCASTPVSGWSLGIQMSNGGSGATTSTTTGVTTGATAFTGGISGVSLNGTGTGGFYSAPGGSSFFGTNTNDNHQFKTQKLNNQAGLGSRVTWTKIR